jgi:class 3 adenylate cyclase/tetratricopeptide (TPR) repeat protein
MICDACNSSFSEGFKFCPMCGAPVSASTGQAIGVAREARKYVSALFIDIVDSTALAERLDPEALRYVIDRYFSGCSASIAAHGGQVEKFIGDAVLAVFGADVTHEDDALRAVRAAADSLSALSDLNADLASTHGEQLEARCGVCSGEVVALVASGGDFRVVGDAVNTASRLQNAAGPGEILIDASTANMVRPNFGLVPVPPLTLKGKASAVPAWRVMPPELSGTAAGSRQLGPFVGRSDELDQVRQVYERVLRRRQPCLLTVVGPPGIGKSRLVREFLAGFDGSAVTTMSGRCSSYGRGLTYQPLTEALASYPGGWPALSRILAADDDRGQAVSARLATILDAGIGGSDAPACVEEIAWAVRCLFEILGEAGPAVVIWEDIHWAEQTLLDLIDDVANWLSDVPVLMVCAARPDLLDAQPGWGGGKPCAITLDVPPLSPGNCAELVAELTLTAADVYAHQADSHAGVIAECDGNPLFIELMLEIFADSAPAAGIPPTIHAVLGARLDRLPGPERHLVEQAAVIGREFDLDFLLAISQEEGTGGPEVHELTSRLVRRRLFQRGTRPGSYRFTQALLRDTAYTFTPKARRERWHQLLAHQIAQRQDAAGSGADADGAMALVYHVETAYTLRRELNPGEARPSELALRAADLLVAEGNAALRRKDLPAAATLLERGRNLMPAGDPRHVTLALKISDTWVSLWDADRAQAILTAARAAMPGNHRAALTCDIQRLIIALRLGSSGAEEISASTGAIEAELAADPGNDESWCRLFQLRAYLHFAADHAGDAGQSLRLALDRARVLGDEDEEERLLCAICELSQWDPTPVSAGLTLCDELTRRFESNRPLLAPVLVTQARLAALAGDTGTARRTLATALGHARELHLVIAEAAALEVSGFVESMSGAYGAAEAAYGRVEQILRAAGQLQSAQTVAAARARALFEQGQAEQARAALATIVSGQPEADLSTQALAQALSGRLEAARGTGDNGVAAGREAVRLAGQTQDPCLQANVLFDLGVVLAAAGQHAEAAAVAQTAITRCTAKGAKVIAMGIRRWLAGEADGNRWQAGPDSNSNGHPA